MVARNAPSPLLLLAVVRALKELATPHLGGVLEERVGVAMKGNSKHGLDPLFDMYQLEEEEEEDEDMVVPRQMPALTSTVVSELSVHNELHLHGGSIGSTTVESTFTMGKCCISNLVCV